MCVCRGALYVGIRAVKFTGDPRLDRFLKSYDFGWIHRPQYETGSGLGFEWVCPGTV